MMCALMLVLFAQNAGYALLAPGEFHNDEVAVAEDMAWLSLTFDGEGWRLIPWEPAVTQVHDPLLDREGEATGWQVGEDGDKALLFLCSPAGEVVPGEVNSVLVQTGDLTPGDFLPLGGEEAILVEADGLYYSRGGDCQKLSEVYETQYGEGVSVLWMGDLDGDGKNDIVLDDKAHYAIYMNYRLFVSSKAEDGELLREVASFTAVSC